MRLAALGERADEDEEINHPDDGEPKIDIPFRLGIFLRLGDAHQIAGGGEHDEQLVAPEHEPGSPAPGKTRARRALHHIERARDQSVAAEGEDDGRGVERAQTAKSGPGQIEVEDGKGELPGDEVADEEPSETPEHRGDDAGANDAIGISGLVRRRRLAGETIQHVNAGHGCGDEQDAAMDRDARVLPRHGPHQSDRRANADAEQRRPVRERVPFLALRECRHVLPLRGLPNAAFATSRPPNLDADQNSSGVGPRQQAMAAKNTEQGAKRSRDARTGQPSCGEETPRA